MTYQKIFEDKNYLVINKPAGIIMHGAKHIKELSLADQIVKDYPEIKYIGEETMRPGMMHRLDKLASGLIVLAKTQAAFESLKNQFQNRTIKKTYTALVYGKIQKDEGKIDFPINRSSKGYKMAALPQTVKGEKNILGKPAVTEFFVIKRFINYTLLKVKIMTGRTHQIRVHLAAYGYPVVGDDLYGARKHREKNKKLGITRYFLVADGLEFIDLGGAVKKFSIDLPDDLKKLLTTIK